MNDAELEAHGFSEQPKGYDVWVDFNEISLAECSVDSHPCDSHMHSILAYSPDPAKVVVGARLIGGDDAGNTCEVTVADWFEFTVNRRRVEVLVCLVMHEDTFKGVGDEVADEG